LPEEITTLLCTFSKLDDAARTVSSITSSSIIPRTLEIMDHESIQAIENYKNFGLPIEADALLLIEVDGSHSSVSNDAEKIADICSSNNGKVSVADDIYSRNRIWEARRSISQALYNIRPSKINEDIVVPRGRVSEMFIELNKISENYNLTMANFGHAGDGNIHVNIMTDRSDKDEYEKAERAVRDIFEATVKLEGTISGEHGIGLTKKDFIDMELSEVSIKLMKEVKNVFDPKGIMNPGKIFP
jgi:glycolate oxidase